MIGWKFTVAVLLTVSISRGKSNSSNITDYGYCDINNPYYCKSGDECIQRRNFCNTIADCSDGSDETRYEEKVTSGEGIGCYVLNYTTRTVKQCLLPKQYKCDHEVDCTLGEDECDCEHSMECNSLPPGAGKLRDRQCIIRSMFCNNMLDCGDASDEIKYGDGVPGYQCAVSKTRAKFYCMLPMRNACDGTADCDDSTDECFCDETGKSVEERAYANDRCFRCLDKSLVIPNKKLCDNTFQCQDLSDECLCENKPEICDKICTVGKDCGNCSVGQVMCSPSNSTSQGTCINRKRVCDRTYDCPHLEDESHCDIDFSQFFNCSDGLAYIPKYHRCDNYKDCDDGSDEAFCNSTFFECTTYYYSNVRMQDGNNAYEFARPRYAVPCDQIPTCEDFEDECNRTLCGFPLPSYCDFVNGSFGFICPNGIALIGTEICDGFPTCLETSPSESADEFDCPDRLYCKDKGATGLPIHIPTTSRCDGISDCYDESDEMGCNETTHFYCDSGFPTYLQKDKVCNGIQDCSDGKDECQRCSKSPFSSDAFLINSYALQVVIWLIGLFAVFGNIAVLVHNTLQLIKQKHSMNAIAHCHRLLVINLAVADFLLGVYLIGLGIINSLYSGIYCREDIQWRTSSPCVGIGVIAVISVECSVFILSIMASMRLFLVTKPMNSRLQPRYILAGLTSAWVVSLILAVVPLSSSQIDYFISEIWYQNNPFLTLANRTRVEELTNFLWTLQDKKTSVFMTDLSSSLTWVNMIETVARLNNTFVPNLYFGYYSSHGVCLPRMFPDPLVDRSWGFSLFVVIVNFVNFAYMLCAYIAIYRITVKKSRRAGMSGDEASLTLQHKISRIIISNFCCWIPICIMAFISAGGGLITEEAYAASAIILLPINSAFNPFLYSDLPERIWEKFFAATFFGKWIEAKRVERVETRRKRSRASSMGTTAMRSKELSRLQVTKTTNNSPSHSEKTKI